MGTPIAHASNFLTVLDVRPLRYVDTGITPGNAAAAAVEGIRTSLRDAAEASARGRHSLALTRYRSAQAACYALLNPAVGAGTGWFDPRLTLPVGVAVESAFSTASTKLLEAMRADLVFPVSPVAMASVGGAVDTAAAAVGFRPANAGPEADIRSGTDLLAKGDARAALPILERAAAAVSDDPSLEAVGLLNLSSALLATGGDAAAADAATRAAAAFETSGDASGAAQALHAAGLAAQRAGDTAAAEAHFAKAKTALAGVTGFAAETPHGNGNGNGNGDDGAGGGLGLHRLGRVRAVRDRVFGVDESAVGLDIATLTLAAPTTTRVFVRGAAGVDDVSALRYIQDATATVAPLRWLDSDAVVTLPIDQLDDPVARRATWSVGIPAAGGIADLVWQKDKPAPVGDLVDRVLLTRKAVQDVIVLVPPLGSTTATTAYLTHVYSFVIPMGIADANHALGDYAAAEAGYLTAAGYTYLNADLEAPNLWVRIARNRLAWGDSLYKYERIDEARAAYAPLATADGTADATAPLYAHPALATTGAVAAAVMAAPDAVPAGTNPAVAEVVLTALARWAHLAGGLDFFGLTYTPTFTFEYLQQVARAFAQQAVQAEREYVNFTVQAEAEASARRDLESSLAMAGTEVKTQTALADAAAADAAAAAHAVDFAALRRDDAQESRDEYTTAGYWQSVAQSMATANGAGKDWHESEIRELAQQIESGSAHGDGAKLAAAATLLGGQKSYEYQLTRLQEQIDEAAAAVPIAQAQRAAADARAKAAALQAQSAAQRRAMLADALNAFDDEVFTPELWTRMAAIVRDIARTYQEWAVGAAKLMERAFDFETDGDVGIIRPEYSVPATGDLLGSDLLMRDIDSFTYRFVSAVSKKESAVKSVVSLRNDYPLAFRDFLRTGRLTVDTSLYDFDRRHPGTFSQRLRAVEVEIVGLVPAGGVRGTLQSGGISHYRTEDGGQRTRVHGVDTMVLSDYAVRSDSFVFRSDVTRLGLFEGHGVATSWDLELPPGANNLDYRLITDVQLVLYYTARHSDALRDLVLAMPLRPGEDVHTRDFALRYDFPEVWFGLLQTGSMTWQLSADAFPRNETSLTIDQLAIALEGAEGVDLSGVAVTVHLPGGAAVTATTDARGAVAAEAGNALAAAMGGAALGEWSLTIAPPAGSALRTGAGRLDATRLTGASLVVQYGFEYRK